MERYAEPVNSRGNWEGRLSQTLLTTEEKSDPPRWLPGGEPITLHQARSRGVILSLHGFTATPYAVRPVAQACFAAGFDVIAPVLPGHGLVDPAAQRRAMARLKPADLLAAVREELRRARDRYEVVGIYGDSMGGAIALILAAEGGVDACAVTAAALKLPFRGEVLCRYFGWLNLNLSKRLKRPEVPCYRFENSRAGRSLWEVSRLARAALPQVNCPVWVGHSRGDRTVPPIVVDWLRDRVAGPVQVRWFDRSGHLLPRDVEGPEVAAAIATFFSQTLAKP